MIFVAHKTEISYGFFLLSKKYSGTLASRAEQYRNEKQHEVV